MKQGMGALSGSREPSPSVSALTGFDPARLRLERYDRISTRICEGDRVIAMIEALSNGRWIISNLRGEAPIKRSFGTVQLAFAWFRGPRD